jgi:hypothetical protein
VLRELEDGPVMEVASSASVVETVQAAFHSPDFGLATSVATPGAKEYVSAPESHEAVTVLAPLFVNTAVSP